MKIIDLSKEIYSGMPVYPDDPSVTIDKYYDIDDKGYNLSLITFGSHTGTHVDSFSHMKKDGTSLSDIPLDRFMGDAIKMDPCDIFLHNIGLIFEKEVSISIFDKIKDANPNFVAGNISDELERYLLNEDIITYTDLINLDKLPSNQIFTFIALPLRIRGGDGSPVRAIAIL